MENEKYIRFDWAAKRILRQKANYGVLEGLVTVLLGEPIKIVELLESEANQDDATAKFNRVDIKARNSKGEIIIVEIQLTREPGPSSPASIPRTRSSWEPRRRMPCASRLRRRSSPSTTSSVSTSSTRWPPPPWRNGWTS